MQNIYKESETDTPVHTSKGDRKKKFIDKLNTDKVKLQKLEMEEESEQSDISQRAKLLNLNDSQESGNKSINQSQTSSVKSDTGQKTTSMIATENVMLETEMPEEDDFLKKLNRVSGWRIENQKQEQAKVK
jgi:hypothetical protein